MGKMSLGLEDRSARLLSGRDVWSEIKLLLSGYNDVQAAIAFVGADADQYLPLRGPATIVVNAGEDALRNGWTDPAVLLRWTRRGVRVHTLSTLHAKLMVAQGSQPFVLVGSADVLSTSGRAMEEAILLADEKDTVDEVRRAIDRWRRLAGEPLTDAWLQAAALRYRAPGTASAAAGSPSAVTDPPVTVMPRPVVTPTPAVTPAPAPAAPPTPVALVEPTATAQTAAPAALPEIEPVEAVAPAEAEIVAVDEAPPAVESTQDAASVDDAPATARTETTAQTAQESSGDAAPSPTADVASAPTAATEADPSTASDGAVAAQTQAAPAPAVPVLPPIWPRPKFIYLATLTRDGRASDSAHEQLDVLRADHRVPADPATDPLLDVEMFWWDAPTRSAAKSTSYREGWHIVPISVPASGRPAVLSPVHSPGRVLHSFTEYAGGPARTYYYLLIHQQGVPTTFRKLREALTAVGEKPSYDHAYMMQHKVAAILDLWPTIHYTG
jgi:hypothetical protein